jgi:type IV pilus assembly protein PilN
MIRINLLPREEKAHREVSFSFPKVGDLVLPVAVLVLTAIVIGGATLAQAARINKLQQQIAQVDEESRALAPQIERVNRLAQERAELDLRLGIISKLQKGRSLSVRLMDELGTCLPDHLWLLGADQSGETLALEGITFSNLVVSDFMTRLDRSPMFAGVELEVAERAQVSERDVVRFRLTCRITPDEPAQ